LAFDKSYKNRAYLFYLKHITEELLHIKQLMNPLELNFLRTRPPLSTLSKVILLLCILATFYSLFSIQLLIQKKDALIKEISVNQNALNTIRNISGKNRLATIKDPRLQINWSLLFVRLEHVGSSRIALHSIDVDSDNAQVVIHAEANTEQDMIDYLERLKAEPIFTNALLNKHEMQLEQSAPKIKFRIQLQWLLK